jgi:hypothetical protein
LGVIETSFARFDNPANFLWQSTSPFMGQNTKEHSRHPSFFNFLVNLLAGLVAYTYRETKPALDLLFKGLPALYHAIF